MRLRARDLCIGISVFSLLLAFVAILGFAFHGDPSFQADVRDSALRQMPVIGPQVSGSVEYVSKVVKGSSQTYGGFAVVVGLLSWLFLGAQATLIAAEVNVVRERRLWPRALGGRLGAADERALRATAQAERSDPREQITVTFELPRRTSPDPEDAG